MSTYFELSRTAQEQVLATIKQGQELALAGIERWASAAAPFAKLGQPLAFEVPAVQDVVASSFGFAEQLLASQKAFAAQVVAAASPVLATSRA